MAGKLWKYLPKPTSFSVPSGNAKAAAASFSGPVISIIPKEARRNKKSDAEAFDAQEPTSPKVSCIGQIKHKKSSDRKSKSTKKKPPKAISRSFNEREVGKMEQKPSGIKGMFRQKVRPGRAAVEEVEAEEVAVVPAVGLMRKYASGRETLVDFDWRTVVAAEEDEEEERVEVMVSHSGPILLGGGVVAREVLKRKEVNLWKRRTSAAPEPLRVN